MTILDGLPEVDYKNLTMIASQIWRNTYTNIVFIIKERQWVKSTVDWSSADTHLEI
jgi:hypothetical protein